MLLKNRKYIFLIIIGSYERKGVLYKKSTSGHTFKKRNFVLMSEQLFYYKKNTEDKDPYFNLISLQNARVAIVKAPPELVKKERMYKHCL